MNFDDGQMDEWVRNQKVLHESDGAVLCICAFDTYCISIANCKL